MTRELFDMVEERAEKNTIARDARMPRRAHKTKCAPRLPSARARALRTMRTQHGGLPPKGLHWYRCQYVNRRGAAAAELANHPKVHGIKEDNILEPILDFLARRVFGPDRLNLLRDVLADATASSWKDHDAELERLDD